MPKNLSSNQDPPRPPRKSRRARRWLAIISALYLLPVGYMVAVYYTDGSREVSWWNLNTDSSRQAPDPAATDDAIIQVYAARAVRWRGTLGVHSWIATKKSDHDHYTRLEVMGYALRWGNGAVRMRQGQPDRYWYGSRPQLLRELRGGREVDALIDKLHQASESYRYDRRYSVWPGPNSNTFIAHLARQVPQLKLELPPTAIGKDYLPGGRIVGRPPSGTGLQVNLGGLLGLILSREEGIEFNLLGLTAGLDLSPFAIKLPGIGRIGKADFQRIELRAENHPVEPSGEVSPG